MKEAANKNGFTRTARTPRSFARTAGDDTIVLAQFVNTSIVVSIAIITAGGYAIFTTRKPEALSAARAALAAVFIASAGGAAMPMWLCVALGVAAVDWVLLHKPSP